MQIDVKEAEVALPPKDRRACIRCCLVSSPEPDCSAEDVILLLPLLFPDGITGMDSSSSLSDSTLGKEEE